ncbi:S41 family peptidase [uncultured Paludibaculum sp.]|uniref:S41 family peptidase n=1 Tax=uncultured Paludibaculum sp. TaxID=1765020 RepID=UPI002AAB1B16|nr:S41 family peptidase [uncultured Paludibaculum sp.]
MVIEDARDQVEAAIESLRHCGRTYGRPGLQVSDVPSFFAAAESEDNKLTPAEKHIIVDQAILLLDQLYAHLPFKRARYAVDPVQRLRLVRSHLRDDLPEVQFHTEMVAALASLRDAHTFYGLPSPFRDALAFLPFRLNCYFEEHKPRFLVTRVLESFVHPDFAAGAEVTFWNGMPVGSAIDREAELDPSGNQSAQFARALNRLTARSLTFSVPRDERWVTLEYRSAADPEKEMGIVLPWNIISGGDFLPLSGTSSSSVYAPQVQQANYRKLLWDRYQMQVETIARSAYGSSLDMPQPPADHEKPDDTVTSRIPEVFEFQHPGGAPRQGLAAPRALTDPAHPEKHFAYLALKSFDGAEDDLVQEFQRILELLYAAAPDGLILDVRSNPGGSIQAAERMLQMLTPREIRPAGFHFISTPMTHQIAIQISGPIEQNETTLAEWQPWVDDLLNSVAGGGILTAARQLTSVDAANSVGQIYQGPVLLLVDALSYSATDIFCGGFQDNNIGLVVGVDPNTGGGGANRWLHSEIVEKTAGLEGLSLVPLPRDATLGLAIRRSSRVGDRAGSPLEDTGVVADEVYDPTRNDLLNQDEDLIKFACGRLSNKPSSPLRILDVAAKKDHLTVKLTAGNLDRLECIVDGLPQCAVAAAAGEQTIRVPLAGLSHPPRLLKILGYTHQASRLSGALAAAGIMTPAAQTLESTLTLMAAARKEIT